jgi:uncharacterized membrane protein YgdD (TMEM256/DUF423 family)
VTIVGVAWALSRVGTPLMLHDVDVRAPWTALQLCLFVAVGLELVGLAVADLRSRRDAGAWLLACTVLGTLAFAGVIAWSVSGRHILPIAPAVGILVVRRLEARGPCARGHGTTARPGCGDRARSGMGRCGAREHDTQRGPGDL